MFEFVRGILKKKTLQDQLYNNKVKWLCKRMAFKPTTTKQQKLYYHHITEKQQQQQQQKRTIC